MSTAETIAFKEETLVDVLLNRAKHKTNKKVFTFIAESGDAGATFSFGELDSAAKAIALHLLRCAQPGDRALLLYPPGLDFIAGFFGCLYAGLIAVPAYPPRKNQNLGRLQAIAEDCAASVVMTTSKVMQVAAPLFNATPGLTRLEWLASDTLERTDTTFWSKPAITADSLAFLQYTSGSTGSPKGVMVSHGNLVYNEEMIRTAFGFTANSNFVSWLPLFHDMGLIGTCLQPLYVGSSCLMLSPAAFLQQPLRWLQAISDFRAEVTVAPNFAYELAVKQITAQQREGLDLSCMTHALCGSEPIRAETVESFIKTYARHGFKREAFYPTYGLAEATLLVSGGGAHHPKMLPVDMRQLEAGRAAAPSKESATVLVGNGETSLEQQIVIVDPATQSALPDGCVGEIWVKGNNVCKGYWNKPALSKEIFAAHLCDGEGPFLRTGDLGILSESELYITGRLKDVLIIRGRNHYPTDIEYTVQSSHPALKKDAGAAFTVEENGEQRLVVVQEVERTARTGLNAAQVAAAARQAVALQHEVQLHTLVLIKPGQIPKTSSGKIQRRASKTAFLSGTLEAVAVDSLGKSPTHRAHAQLKPADFSRQQVLAQAETHQQIAMIVTMLKWLTAENGHLEYDQIDSAQPLLALGLDSLQLTRIQARLNELLDVELELADLFEADSVEALAARILNALQIPAIKRATLQPAARSTSMPLSPGQQRLWLLSQQDQSFPLYNLPVAFHLRGSLDVTALQRALQELIRRHEILRTHYRELDGEVYQQIEAECPLILLDKDLSSAPPFQQEQIQHWLHDFYHAPFDLTAAPVMRAMLIHCSTEEHVLALCAHHIAADGWSFGVLKRDLFTLYAAFIYGRPNPLPALPLQYADYASWLQQRSEGHSIRQLNWWAKQLRGVQPLDLKTDKPRPPKPSHRGDTIIFYLEKATLEGLKQVSSRHQVTLFVCLLSLFKLQLARYTRSEDVCIGTPVANRRHSELEGLIGFFVNSLALRTDLAGNPGFGELLRRVQQTAQDAFSHQDIPFDKVVDASGVARELSHSPLFQVMFALQHFPLDAQFNQSALPELAIESLPVFTQTAQFDVTLFCAEEAGRLQVRLEYATDLFERTTMERWASHFINLAQAVTADSEQPISRLNFLSNEERLQLQQWSGTQCWYSGTETIHSRFEQQVAKTPSAIAVTCDAENISYTELNNRANQLAFALLERGVKTNDLIGLCVTPSIETVVGILGILKAGAGYVPMDPYGPKERMAFIADDAAINIVVTQESVTHLLAFREDALLILDNLSTGSGPAPNPGLGSGEDYAYVIYTSGTTGKPKGVLVPHSNALRLFNVADTWFDFNAHDVWALFHSFAFDFTVWEMWGALFFGGRLVVVPYLTARSPQDFYQLLVEQRVTVLAQTPFAFAQLINYDDTQPAARRDQLALRYVLFGGEAADPAAMRKWRRNHAGHRPRLGQVYGVTEATVFNTLHWLTEDDLNGRMNNVGRSMPDAPLYVLDAELNPMPIGVPGELYIGGAGVAYGYLNRPELNAERFVKNPFIELKSGLPTGAYLYDRMYKTGDIVRWLPNGEIEYIGRVDHQVKVRGFRIELGEIEARLCAQAAVREAMVLARDSGEGDKRLIAYLVKEPGAFASAADIAARLKADLPEYMIPAAIVALDAFPLNVNGKVDRDALPEPNEQDFVVSSEFVAPATSDERRIAAIFSEILNRRQVGLYDNFFELGGHSLLATRVLSAIRESFNVEVTVRDFFTEPSVHGIKQAIEQKRGICLLPPIQHLPLRYRMPLSYAQQRMWFLSEFENGDAKYGVSISYNMPVMWRIQGSLNQEAMRLAFQDLVARHEILRTRFVVENGEAMQVIQAPFAWRMAVEDLSNLSSDQIEAAVAVRAQQEATRAFDVVHVSDAKTRRTRLLRTRLLKISESEHVLFMTMHHIISDGWSISILLQEFSACYRARIQGDEAMLPPLSIQYADYAVWQRQLIGKVMLQEQLHYWQSRLKDCEVLELPTDRPRPPSQTFRGDVVIFSIEAELTQRLNELARSRGATLYMLLMSCYSLLLSRHSGQQDICIGSPIANRRRPELEPLIGCFINAMAIRVDLSGNPTFDALLSRVKSATVDAYANQDVPFEILVDSLGLSRDRSHTPIFQVMLSLQNLPIESRMVLPDCEIELRACETHTAKFDMVLNLTETADGLQGEWEFNSDLFDRTRIERMLGHLRSILNEVAKTMDTTIADIPLLNETERAQLLEWNHTADYFSDTTLHALFEAQAERVPDSVALSMNDRQMSYAELNSRANQLAHYLLQQGVQANQRIGLCLPRSCGLIVGVLGILKAGATYVPIDPDSPSERTDFILADAGIQLVVTQQSLQERFSTDQIGLVLLDGRALKNMPTHNSERGNASDCAYVIYTSGTTGRPKGVMIPHRNVVRLFSASEQWFEFTENDVWTLFHSIAFDFSVWEIWGALLKGGRLVIVPYLVSRSPQSFYQLLIKEQVTVLNQTPSAFTQLIRVDDEQAQATRQQMALRYVIFGGEALDFAALYTWQKHHSLDKPQLINMYGITETTVHVTCHPVREQDLLGRASIIGRPIPDLALFVLDEAMNQVPVGVPGELYVGGAGLAQGYLDRPELTRERFIPYPRSLPENGLDRLYKTGDLVRYLPNGDLEYLGRLDNQVKVRGFRIELGEIENVICQFEDVHEACVIAHQDETGDRRLVAYVATHMAQRDTSDQNNFIRELRLHIKAQLPDYMTPSAFALLERFALTANGKIDKRALPVPDSLLFERHEYVPARNDTEQTLVEIWQDVLKVKQIGVHDNFFHLGGHSLIATQVITRMRDVFAVDIALARIFEDPTIEALAMHVVEASLQNSLLEESELDALLSAIELE